MARSEVDLTAESPAGRGRRVRNVDLSNEERGYNPGRDRERARTLLALLIVVTIPIIVILAWAGLLLYGITEGAVKDLSVALLGSVAGLVGAILGFYYATEKINHQPNA